MKTTAKIEKAFTDDIYYVSAADVADKILDHMRRGFDPLLFRTLYWPLLRSIEC